MSDILDVCLFRLGRTMAEFGPMTISGIAAFWRRAVKNMPKKRG